MPPSERNGRLVFWGGTALFAVGTALLATSRVSWDGLTYLGFAARTKIDDPMHLLYPWLLGRAVDLGGLLGVGEERAGALLSGLGATAAFAFLWRLWRRESTPAGVAPLVAALVLTTPDLWAKGTSIEVYLPSIGGWTGAGLAMARLSKRWSLRWAAVALVGMGVAVGCHAAAVLCLPWLASLQGRRWGLGRLGLAAVALVALGGLVLLGLSERWLSYAWSFLPAMESDRGVLGTLGWNARRFGLFFVENIPYLAGAGVSGLVGSLLSRRRLPLEPLVLLVPFALAFLVLGAPVWGLLFPCVVACGGVAVRGLEAIPPGRFRALAMIGLVVLLGAQVLSGWSERWSAARGGDPLRRAAKSLERVVPRGATVLAGQYGRHYRHYTTMNVVLLPDLVQKELATTGKKPHPYVFAARVTETVRASADDVWITNDGLMTLVSLGADLQELELLLRREEGQVACQDPLVWVVSVP